LVHIPKVTGIIATVFVGGGQYAKREAATLAEARAEGLKLAGVHGKKAMINALLPEGLIAMPKKAAAAKGKKAAKAAAPQPPATRQQQRRGGLGRRGWRDAAAAAEHGKMPPCPDFSAPTHNSYRKKT
jgi:hypothetical protein